MTSDVHYVLYETQKQIGVLNKNQWEFVAMKWVRTTDGQFHITSTGKGFRTLEAATYWLETQGLSEINKQPHDDASIVSYWI